MIRSEWVWLVRTEGEGRLEDETIRLFYPAVRREVLESRDQLRELARVEYQIPRSGLEGLPRVLRILEQVSSRSDEGSTRELIAREGIASGESSRRPVIRHAARQRGRGIIQLPHDLRAEDERPVESLLQRSPPKGEIGAHDALPRIDADRRAGVVEPFLHAHSCHRGR